jgi:hypothetical protein
MTVYVADAYGHVQKLFLVVKMAILVEECTTEEQSFVARSFFVSRKSHANDIYK